jgi:transposase
MSNHRFDHNVDRKVDPKPVQRIEVITGVERRRSWSPKEKRAILAESFEDGVVISEVARRHGLRPQQLFTWRNQFRNCKQARLRNADATSAEPPAFAPVMIAHASPEMETPAGAPTTAAEQAPAAIEIVVGAASIRLHGNVDGKALATVLRAVRAVT